MADTADPLIPQTSLADMFFNSEKSNLSGEQTSGTWIDVEGSPGHDSSNVDDLRIVPVYRTGMTIPIHL